MVKIRNINMEEYVSDARDILSGFLTGESQSTNLNCAIKAIQDDSDSVENKQMLERACYSAVRHSLFRYIRRRKIVTRTEKVYCPSLGIYKERGADIDLLDVPKRLLDVYKLIPDFSQRVAAFALEIRKQEIIQKIEDITANSSLPSGNPS